MRLQFATRTGENVGMVSRERNSAQDGSGEMPPAAIDTRKKILVIDDDPVTVKALTQSLSGRGFAVYSASDGSAAIGVMRDEIPDMLLVDVNLSTEDVFGAAGPWDGFQVTRWLRYASARDVPAIIISGSDKEDYKKYAEMIDAEAFMVKPLSNARLFESIESALAR
jgi:CheY-like chemotaxis protein